MKKYLYSLILFLLTAMTAITAIAQVPSSFRNAEDVVNFMKQRPQFSNGGNSSQIIEMWYNNTNSLFFMKILNGKKTILLKTPAERVKINGLIPNL